VPALRGTARAAELVALALAATTLPAATADAARARSCLRGGAELELAAGHVRVVRVAAEVDRAHGVRRHEKLVSCWQPTGRRRLVSDEFDTGSETATTRVEIVDRRFVGVFRSSAGDFALHTSAAVYDARSGRRLHRSARCDSVVTGDGNRGPELAVFLPSGGMAFSCDGLYMYARRGCGLRQIEPPGTQIGALATAHRPDPVLFWTVIASDGETANARRLGARGRCR
jgi:hypothetical protein